MQELHDAIEKTMQSIKGEQYHLAMHTTMEACEDLTTALTLIQTHGASNEEVDAFTDKCVATGNALIDALEQLNPPKGAMVMATATLLKAILLAQHKGLVELRKESEKDNGKHENHDNAQSNGN